MNQDPCDPKGEAAASKCPLHLVPAHPIHESAWVFACGRDKYGERNWLFNRVKASVYYAAMRRHLDQWFDGLEDQDAETSRSHLAHVIASACIVMDAGKHGSLVDDRPRQQLTSPDASNALLCSGAFSPQPPDQA